MPLKVFENLVCFKKVSGTKIQVLRREQPKSVDVESDLAMVLPPTSTRGRRAVVPGSCSHARPFNGWIKILPRYRT